MSERIVVFLRVGNTARSILSESILRMDEHRLRDIGRGEGATTSRPDVA